MRIGYNPHKDQKQPESHFTHQVIIPVYIPDDTGYFSDSLVILEFCLKSLLLTSHSKTYFTVVNNGSNDKTRTYLEQLWSEGLIHELIHTSNIGKLNAVLKGMAGHNFPLVTIADSDVLFLNDWQQQTYSVFDAFPKAAVVSPVPSSRMFRSFTAILLLEKLFSSSLRFSDVQDPAAMKAFAASIDNPALYNEYHLQKYLTVSSGGIEAVVGAGHFVSTYKQEVLDLIRKRYSPYNLGGNSERDLLDVPAAKAGLWRLSTTGNHAYHMGNIKEPWMAEQFDKLKPNTFEPAPLAIGVIKRSWLVRWFAHSIFQKILFYPQFVQWFLRHKGLSSLQAKHYL